MSEVINLFLLDHGISLVEEGSFEKGLSKSETLELLTILAICNVKVLGLEVWHLEQDGRYKIDSLAGWASSTSSEAIESIYEAKNIIQLEARNESVFFTVQF